MFRNNTEDTKEYHMLQTIYHQISVLGFDCELLFAYQDSLKLSGSLRVRNPKTAHRKRRRRLKERGVIRFWRGRRHKSSTYRTERTGIWVTALGRSTMAVPTDIPACNDRKHYLQMNCIEKKMI